MDGLHSQEVAGSAPGDIRQINPSYLAVFDDWAGQLLLAGSVVSIAIGYAAMLWTTRLPGEPRVLR